MANVVLAPLPPAQNQEAKKGRGKPRTRSPGYPSISLKTAIDKARVIYTHEKRNPAHMEALAADWEINPKSSSFMLAVAALKKYGLLEEVDGGKERRLKLTQAALNILLNDQEDSPERIALLKQCALAPKIHAQLWKLYDGDLPSDSNLKRHLILEMQFNDAAVDAFIKDLRDTIAFAKLSSSDKITTVATDEVEEPNETETRLTSDTPITRSASHISNTPASTAVLREFTFPLSAGMAALKIPFPIADDDFDFFVETLKLWRKKLVKPPAPKRPFIPLPADAMWNTKDLSKPVKLVACMGEKDGERYFQSEDGTGIPESQLTFGV